LIKYLLDTNICIYIIKKSPQKVFEKIKTLKIGEVAISSITYCELQFGVSNSSSQEKNQNALNGFLSSIEILDFPSASAILYGEVCSHLKKKGIPIGPLELLIGTHALFADVTLVTNNVKEFKRIPKLKMENWA